LSRSRGTIIFPSRVGAAVARHGAVGRKELWTFFWLAIANTTIIAVAGIATWMLVPH
jgi:hypothetical protein